MRGAAVADEVASSAAWKRGDLSVGLEFLTWASEAFEGRREGREIIGGADGVGWGWCD